MPTYNATNWPAMQYPGATSSSKAGGTAEAPDAPPSALPRPTAKAVEWDAAATPANTTTKESPVTTQQGINTTFGIVDLRLDGESA